MRFSDIVRKGSAFHIKGSGETHTLHRISEEPRRDRPKEGPPPVGPKVSETVEFSAVDGEPLPKGPVHLSKMDRDHMRQRKGADRQVRSSYGINDMDREGSACAEEMREYNSAMASPQKVSPTNGRKGLSARTASKVVKPKLAMDTELHTELMRTRAQVISGNKGTNVSQMSAGQFKAFLKNG